MSKIIVTGGAGFIGSHLADGLIEEGHDVHVVDNLVGGNKNHVNAQATLHEVDIRDYDALQEIFQGAEYVFHEAALPRVQLSIDDPVETHEVNVTGLLNVLRASHESGVKRLVYAASSSVYGDHDEEFLNEGLPPRPLSPYALQKYVGELYCETWNRVYGLETVSLRYFNVYGPRLSADGAYASVVAKFLKQQREGGPLTVTGDGEQTRDFIHVRDVVAANIAAMRSDKVGSGEVINIGSAKKTTINNLSSLIGGQVTYIDARLEPRHSQSDITKAYSLLGWKPHISFDEGVSALLSA